MSLLALPLQRFNIILSVLCEVLHNQFSMDCSYFQAGAKLQDIPSIEDPGSVLGSLEFSETFLSSKIFVEKDGKLSMWSS